MLRQRRQSNITSTLKHNALFVSFEIEKPLQLILRAWIWNLLIMRNFLQCSVQPFLKKRDHHTASKNSFNYALNSFVLRKIYFVIQLIQHWHFCGNWNVEITQVYAETLPWSQACFTWSLQYMSLLHIKYSDLQMLLFTVRNMDGFLHVYFRMAIAAHDCNSWEDY